MGLEVEREDEGIILTGSEGRIGTILRNNLQNARSTALTEYQYKEKIIFK